MPKSKKPESKKLASRRFANYLPRLLLALSAVLMIIGLGLAFHQQQVNVQTVKQATASGLAPSTVKPAPSQMDTYTVAPDLPRYLIIPKLTVKARVGAVGLTKAGAIGSPTNVYDTDWYNGSSKPGQPGVTLIDGHVSSWTTHGVFYSLDKLQAGDAIQIERGDGALLNYSVVKTQTYDADNIDMSAVLSPVDPTKSGLNLITCAGDVIKGTNEFNERIVIFASQV